MKILVVGGTGFLGYHIVCALLDRGHHVKVLARTETPHLPTAVEFERGDIQAIRQPDLDRMVAGCAGVVFAAGAAVRVPRGVATTDYFHQSNVQPTVRLITAARDAGCDRAAVLGSYFATAERQHPQRQLAARSPYIRSRVEQAAHARSAGGDQLPIAVLEIPYVAGATPGRHSALTPMARMARGRLGPIAFPGGTAVVSAPAVGRAAACALERQAVGNLPIATANLTWAELMRRLAVAAGREPTRIRSLHPTTMLVFCTLANWLRRAQGVTPGLDPVQVGRLLSTNVFVDLRVTEDLGVGPDDLDQALRDTVAAL